MKIEIHAICPKCGADYGKPTDVKNPGKCGECLWEHTEIVSLELRAIEIVASRITLACVRCGGEHPDNGCDDVDANL